MVMDISPDVDLRTTQVVHVVVDPLSLIDDAILPLDKDNVMPLETVRVPPPVPDANPTIVLEPDNVGWLLVPPNTIMLSVLTGMPPEAAGQPTQLPEFVYDMLVNPVQVQMPVV